MNGHGGKRRGAGGPRGPRSGTATTVLQIRLHPKEKRCLQERAARRGLSVTEFIKERTLMGREEGEQ